MKNEASIMSVPVAYLGIIIVWSTTPLAIKWSGEEVGFLFGITGRILLAAVVSLCIIAMIGKRLPRHKQAWQAYMAIGIPLYLTMMCVYWGAQHVPSGLISVIFGLTPFFTGVIASLWLCESSFSVSRIVGIALGFVGLSIIFGQSIDIDPKMFWGMAAILMAVFLHSFGTVWFKSIGSSLPALVVNTGGLLMAGVLYFITWWLTGNPIPEVIPQYTAISIVYLSLVGSVCGAVMFYYALTHVEANKMALLTLITPVTALFLGHWFNGESIAAGTIVGTGLILLGLLFYQLADVLFRHLYRLRNLLIK